MAVAGTTAKRTAFITGASYGIGAATALAFARGGFQLALSATHLDHLAETMRAVSELGVPVKPVTLDLRSQASIDDAVPQIIDALGAVDVLVNNAGANLRAPALDVTRDQWNGLIDTNVTGTFFLSQQVAKHQITASRPGCLVNIVSVQGLFGARERSAYGISKAAVVQMTRMLAIEWAEHGIRVNAIAPGRVETDSPSRKATASNPDYMKAMLDRIPLHRFATADEVAAAACYLAGSDAASITGHTLVLDGGFTAA